MTFDWSVDKLVLNKHEALLLRVLMQEWEVLEDQAQELEGDLEVCLRSAMGSNADMVQCLLEEKRQQKSDVVQAALFLSGGIEDTLFGDASDWLVVE